MLLHLCLFTYLLVLFPQHDTKSKRFGWGGMCLFPFATDVIIVAFCTHVHMTRGVPAYTQSTQLRTLIFECPKNKNVLNRENAIKTCLTRVRSLHYKYTNFVIILNQSNRILTVFHFCFRNN